MNITPEKTASDADHWRPPLAAYSLHSLSNIFKKHGFPRYRAIQVMDWFYKKNCLDWTAMKNISAPVQRFLDENFVPLSSHLVAAHDAGDGAAKLEIALSDGLAVEAVLIETPRRVTLCLSSQVGCPLGCAFCATGAGGFQRDLFSHEIIEQALHASALLDRRRISNLVFMGMGEPCLNLDAVFDAVRTLNAPYSFHVGARHITISTVGNPACIERIAALPLDVSLAVSLHAADESLRQQLMPGAPAGPADTVDAAWEYFKKTGREVTFEYVLIQGLNDSTSHARALAYLLAGKHAFVNLIPYNEVEGLLFRSPSPKKIAGFLRSLASHGINAHVRQSRGGSAHAACGQLRLKPTLESQSD